jgi:hypothetical protein
VRIQGILESIINENQTLTNEESPGFDTRVCLQKVTSSLAVSGLCLNMHVKMKELQQTINYQQITNQDLFFKEKGR